MALSSKITELYITNNTWVYTFKVKDVALDIGQVNYGAAYDEAIDGSLRSNIRGYRMSIDLPINKIYDSVVEKAGTPSATFITFLDDMLAHMQSNDFISISLKLPDYYNFIPDMASYRVAYTNQIARASGSLKFIGQGIITTIDTPLQAPSV
jgi:hypothetical protein